MIGLCLQTPIGPVLDLECAPLSLLLAAQCNLLPSLIKETNEEYDNH